MKHYMTTGYLVSFESSGRHGSYGSTTSVIGIFNTEKRASEAKDTFIDLHIKNLKISGPEKKYEEETKRHNMKHEVKIVPIKMGEIDEQILSKVYE